MAQIVTGRAVTPAASVAAEIVTCFCLLGAVPVGHGHGIERRRAYRVEPCGGGMSSGR
jgi:hypothetical protein